MIRPTPPNPPLPCAAPPAYTSHLPPWQKRRIQVLSELCAEIHKRIGEGQKIRDAIAAVSQAAQERHPAGIPRCPLSAQSLTRFYYRWLSSGSEYLELKHGGEWPAVSEGEALEFLNWITGRRTRNFAATWREFCRFHKSPPADRSDMDVRDWFRGLRRRIAQCEAKARKRGDE